MNRVIIKESQLKTLINEGLSKRLFHFTSLERGARICNSDSLLLQASFAKSAEESYAYKGLFYLSCTRRRDARVGYSRKFSSWGGVRIEFDGEKLAYNFKGMPLNYWNGLGDKFMYSKAQNLSKDDLLNSYEVRKFVKDNPDASNDDIMNYANNHFNDSAQYNSGDESEDRVFFKNSVLSNVHKYITKIDVLIPKEEYSKEEIGNYYSLFKSSRLNRLVNVFDDLNEFNKPNGKPLQYEDVEDTYVSTPKITAMRDKNNLSLVSDILSFITYGNPMYYNGSNFYKKVKNLLTKYGLESYIDNIEYIRGECGRQYSIRSAFDRLSASMTNNIANADLSRDKSGALQMLADYMNSLGVHRLRDLLDAKEKELSQLR